jgi:hypothetical protein
MIKSKDFKYGCGVESTGIRMTKGIQKVGFDFDGTLTRVDVQRYARVLVKYGIQVHIVTARHKQFDLYDSEHMDLTTIACKIGIPDEHIHFLNCSDKSKFYRDNKDFIFHLDDSWFTVDDINEHSDVISVCVLDDGWVMKCDELLNEDPMAKVTDDVVKKRVKDILKKRDGKDPIALLDEIKSDLKKTIKDGK